ncbi:MAG: prepilin-type N-terminal cleavage/methylation domain-containing protein [Bacillota bacterium]|nr:prepilin-type N-terminal cleavage/methylation domain-containing protein [Bacillota bacterium]
MQKLMKRFHKNQKGFTLVELMVVVVIIGILVAIAIPVYQGIQANARNSACSANIRTLSGAVAQFYTEVGSYPVDLDWLWVGYNKTQGGVSGTGDVAEDEIIRFIEEEPICPWGTVTDVYGYSVKAGDTGYAITCPNTDDCANAN